MSNQWNKLENTLLGASLMSTIYFSITRKLETFENSGPHMSLDIGK